VANTIGERLAELRKKHGLSARQLGIQSGIDPIQVSRIEKGTTPNPSPETLIKLARTMGEDPGVFLTENYGKKNNDGEETLSETLGKVRELFNRMPKGELQFLGEVVKIPIRGYVPAGCPAESEQIDGGYVLVAKRDLGDVPSKKCYSLIVSGESLSGDDINNTDNLVIYEIHEVDIEDKIYIVRIADNQCVARHVSHVDGRLRLRSSNAYYEDIEPEKVEILGRALFKQPKVEPL